MSLAEDSVAVLKDQQNKQNVDTQTSHKHAQFIVNTISLHVVLRNPVIKTNTYFLWLLTQAFWRCCDIN